MNYYTYEAAEKMIDTLTEKGYTPISLREGTLGIGDWVLVAPEENMYNFVIREVYINPWKSGHTIRRCGKISKALQAEIDAAENSEDEKTA